MYRRPPKPTRTPTPFPYPTLFRAEPAGREAEGHLGGAVAEQVAEQQRLAAGGHAPVDAQLGPDDERDHLVGVPEQGQPEPRSQRHHLAGHDPDAPRSEEHTSELQSLMRISYAVFCLKKKKTNQNY